MHNQEREPSIFSKYALVFHASQVESYFSMKLCPESQILEVSVPASVSGQNNFSLIS